MEYNSHTTYSFVISVFALFVILCASVNGQTSTTKKISYSIEEEKRSGFFVGNLFSDLTEYTNITSVPAQDLRFGVLRNTLPVSKLFSVGERTGVIVTNDVIDRENVCEFKTNCLLALEVSVSIKNHVTDNFDLTFVVPVEVEIRDKNDNSPAFPSEVVNLSVSESVPIEYTLLTSGAFDRDSGENAKLSYKIDSQSTEFSLKEIKNLDGSTDLGIVLKTVLDREVTESYSFKILALDKGDPILTGTVYVNIKVSDVNDNKPSFVNNTYNVSIPESVSKDTVVLELSAHDDDINENGRITYHFEARVPSNIKRVINIDEVSGRVTVVGTLDYETATQYKFLVEAIDHGPQPQKSRALVTIDITDVNDNAPEISIKLPVDGDIVDETIPVGAVIGEMSTADHDSGLNGEVKCNILNKKFTLNNYYNHLYRIVVDKSLDYENTSAENITIKCHDAGNTTLESVKTFFLYIRDINDNAPKFTKSIYELEMYENNNIGVFLLSVSATDADTSSGALVYSVPEEWMATVSINPVDGVISAMASFDREDSNELSIPVIASDSGIPSLSSTATLLIKLNDVNDNSPTFEQSSYSFHVSEYAPEGTLIGTISADDPDEGINGNFEMSLLKSSTEFMEHFSFNIHTGEITSISKLDREITAKATFTVLASDQGDKPRSSSVNVVIIIDDENDNIPRIIFPHNRNKTARVPHDAFIGTYITRILALDKDQGDNAKLHYAASKGNDDGLFEIEPDTGIIRVGKEFKTKDYKRHELLVSVTDSGQKPLPSYAKLNIQIFVNNHTTVNNRSSGSFTENMTIVVILVVATVIISIAILATIIVIRRSDKIKEKQHGKGHGDNNMSAFEIIDVLPVETEPPQKKKKSVKFVIADETKQVQDPSMTELPKEYSDLHKLRAAEKTAEKLAKAEHIARYINHIEDGGSETSESTTVDSGRGVSEGGSQEEIKHFTDGGHIPSQNLYTHPSKVFLYNQYGDSYHDFSEPTIIPRHMYGSQRSNASRCKSPGYTSQNSNRCSDLSDNTTIVFRDNNHELSRDITV